ncbi:hypothetical protein Tsubulata_030388 [Turnera subulata]|uniref:rRNA N-glycosylase n=1 Tax=Turnera subulata TaxID=218843 RepID=A0A9Q0GKY7_9ROSI|nr:hypothetical protein Tsubulata_030388 [Turnera subulata]
MKLCRMKLCRVIVAAWVCLSLVVGSRAVRVGPSRVEEEGEEEYPHPAVHHKYSAFQTVEFSFNEATSTKDYKAKLINVMRNQLRSSIYFFGIPSMPTKKVTGVDRFGLVTLKYSSTVAVSLVIDVNNIYVVGFYSNNPSANPQKAYYYFTGDTAYATDASKLFGTGTSVLPLNYGGDYGSIGDRSTVNLGRSALIAAIQTLYNRKDPYGLKNSFTVVIQMISEFVRSDLVMNRVLDNFAASKPADRDMIFVENNWASNSKAVRSVTSSSQYFATPITLPLSPTEPIKNADDAIKVGLVSLLWSPTSTTNTIMQWPAFPHSLQLIK